MRKPISPTMHGVIDYSTVAAVATLPRMFNVPPNARRLFDSLAAGYTGISALTSYPLGVKPVIPFKAHGASEIAIGALLPAMPWLFGFAENRAARNLCFALTAVTAVVAVLTDWDAMDAPSPRVGGNSSSDMASDNGSDLGSDALSDVISNAGRGAGRAYDMR